MDLTMGFLANRCAGDFNSSAKRRGELSFQSNEVRIVEITRDAVFAVVDDLEPAEVSLQVRYGSDGADLFPACSCSHSDPGRCLHVWALILTADSHGWGHGLGAPGEDAGRWQDDENPAYSDEDDDEDEDDYQEPSVWVTHSRGQLPKRPPPSDWRSLLANLDVAPASELHSRSWDPDADRECWLVIDTGETLAQGQLILDCMDRRRKLNGEWGIFKPAVCTIDDLLPKSSTAQTGTIRALLGAIPTSNRGRSRELTGSNRRFEGLALDPSMDRQWWRLLVREVNIAIASQSAAGRQMLPASIDEAAVWTDELEVQRAVNGRDWTISLKLRRDDAVVVNVDEPLVVFPTGLVIFKDRLAWMRPRPESEFQWINILRQRPRMNVPDSHLDVLIGKILALQTVPRILWSTEAVLEGRSWTEEASQPTPILRLNRGVLTMQRTSLVAVQIAYAYGQRHIDGEDRREVLPLERDRHLLRRDMAAEARFLAQFISSSGDLATIESAGRLTMPAEALVRTIERIEKEGWLVEIEKERVRFATATSAQLKSGVDWFELKADCRFSEQSLGLPILLAAIEDKASFVKLADGSVGMLPSQWLERFSTLSQFGQVQDDGLRFGKNQIAILEMLLHEMPALSVDEVFADMRAKMQRFNGIEAKAAPAHFIGQLRSYQSEGLGWLQFLQDFGFGGCLADDMGLGKTIQVLAALPEGGSTKEPALVVVPRSLVYNWMAEASRFRPDLRVLNYDLCPRKNAEEIFKQHDVIVMTYACLRRDITRLNKIAFNFVILDEVQNIKNRSSQTARATRVLRAKHRLALSGTPVENHVDDLLSIFEFLNPGMITETMFRRVKVRNVSENAMHEILGKALRPFILRRTKDQVLTDLPEKTEQTIFCDLEADQRLKYDQLRQHYQKHLKDEIQQNGFEKSKFHVLEALLRLRQAACHSGLIDPERVHEPSAKLEALVEQLVDVIASGHKALVFSQFTSLLAIVRSRLEREGIAHEYLDGQTRDRERRVRRFQNDAAIPVFLISLKAGGVGLNLTAAEYCFILDPWWNPAIEAQAIARAHRIGQSKPVFAYRLIARGTVEEKILELQSNKLSLADAIVNADNASLSKMSLNDLQFLLN